MAALIGAGAVFLLGGLLAIIYGLQIKEFSFGGTLILAGATAASTGALLVGAAVLVRELSAVRRLMEAGHTGVALPPVISSNEPPLIPTVEPIIPDSSGSPKLDGRSGDTPLSPLDIPPAPITDARSEPVIDAPLPEAAVVQKPRRNLLFSSTSRKERERAAAKAAAPSETATGSVLTDTPPVTFDNNWSGGTPPRERTAPPPVAPPVPPPISARPPQPAEPTPQITVLKSGVVDGMAYSLYSDGSIEAQLPEGMMRFTSIDELRSYLDARP